MRPPVIPDRYPLREAFAHDFAPRLREPLERLVVEVGQVAHEAGGPYVVDHGLSTVPADLAAVVADLRFCAGFLAWHEQAAEESEMPPRAAVLCKLAALAASEVEAVAHRIERMVRAVEAGRLPVDAPPVTEDFELVVLAVSPAVHAMWKAAAGDLPLRAWLRQVADQAAGGGVAS